MKNEKAITPAGACCSRGAVAGRWVGDVLGMGAGEGVVVGVLIAGGSWAAGSTKSLAADLVGAGWFGAVFVISKLFGLVVFKVGVIGAWGGVGVSVAARGVSMLTIFSSPEPAADSVLIGLDWDLTTAKTPNPSKTMMVNIPIVLKNEVRKGLAIAQDNEKRFRLCLWAEFKLSCTRWRRFGGRGGRPRANFITELKS